MGGVVVLRVHEMTPKVAVYVGLNTKDLYMYTVVLDTKLSLQSSIPRFHCSPLSQGSNIGLNMAVQRLSAVDLDIKAPIVTLRFQCRS